MKKIKFYRDVFMLLTLLFLTLTDLKTIKPVPCEDKNVVKKENIIPDSECQNNIKLKGVDRVRDPPIKLKYQR